MIKTTAVEKEEVLECADIVESNFFYQMNKACYKSYTLESVHEWAESDNPTPQCCDES